MNLFETKRANSALKSIAAQNTALFAILEDYRESTRSGERKKIISLIERVKRNNKIMYKIEDKYFNTDHIFNLHFNHLKAIKQIHFIN